jgi:hypothetical protein
MADEAQDTPDAAVNNTDEAQSPESHTQTGKPEDGAPKFTQADLDRLIAKAKRDEKAKLERQVSDAQLSETERLKAELEARKAEVRGLKTEGALLAAIKAAGGDDPEVISAWIQSKLTIEFSDDDKISNLKDLLSEARERIPTRFPKRPGSANGGDGKPAGIGTDMNALIRRAAGRIP